MNCGVDVTLPDRFHRPADHHVQPRARREVQEVSVPSNVAHRAARGTRARRRRGIVLRTRSRLTCSLWTNSEGNEYFKRRDYSRAIEKYSDAIQHDIANPVFYSNRRYGWSAAVGRSTPRAVTFFRRVPLRAAPRTPAQACGSRRRRTASSASHSTSASSRVRSRRESPPFRWSPTHAPPAPPRPAAAAGYHRAATALKQLGRYIEAEKMLDSGLRAFGGARPAPPRARNSPRGVAHA